ncbi:hypothetical protein V5O48_010204 [Marasmius crinis-equi]|uniref:Uncharacterized protein n=1 Tax=Marasmius crinis-equi TaxID=585013 RepID=A0ABR3F925_9AGAR
MLDCQVKHADRESVEGLGLWLTKKHSDASSRLWVGQRADEASGHLTEYLTSRWDLQKETQTKPLPKRSNQQGQNAVHEGLQLWEPLTILKGQKTELEQAILDIDSEDWDDNVQKLPAVAKQIVYIEKWEKIHTQIARLVKRKDPGIQKLAQSYNKKVVKMEKLVTLRQAPRNTVPLKRIPMEQHFSLDIDDEIWQDVGLTDNGTNLHHRHGWQMTLCNLVSGGC